MSFYAKITNQLASYSDEIEPTKQEIVESASQFAPLNKDVEEKFSCYKKKSFTVIGKIVNIKSRYFDISEGTTYRTKRIYFKSHVLLFVGQKVKIFYNLKQIAGLENSIDKNYTKLRMLERIEFVHF